MQTQIYSKVPNVKKVAVLRANALGDYIVILPALQALRAAYPKAEIVLLGNSWHKEFLTNRPGPVNRVEIVPKIPGLTIGKDEAADENKINAFYQQMQNEHFDIAVQLHGGGRYSNPFVQKLGARVTVGLKSEDAVPLDRHIPYIYYHYEIHRFLEVVSLVGASIQGLSPRLIVLRKDLKEAVLKLGNIKQPYIVIHPSSSAEYRNWPPNKFASLADKLVALGYKVIIVGVEKEKYIADQVISKMIAANKAVNLCGALSVGGLIGVISGADLFVGNDSGPLHIANALSIPNVGLFWAINYTNWTQPNRYFHRPIISWEIYCKECGKNMVNNITNDFLCPHITSKSLIANVSVGRVFQQCLELLETFAVNPRVETEDISSKNKSLKNYGLISLDS